MGQLIVGPWGQKKAPVDPRGIGAEAHYDAHFDALSGKVQDWNLDTDQCIDDLALWLEADGTIRAQNRAHAMRHWSAMGQTIRDVPLDGVPVMTTAPNGEVTVFLAVLQRPRRARKFEDAARRYVAAYAEDIRGVVASFAGPPIGHIALEHLGLWLRVDSCYEERTIAASHLGDLRWHCQAIDLPVPELAVGQVPVLVLMPDDAVALVPFETRPRDPSRRSSTRSR